MSSDPGGQSVLSDTDAATGEFSRRQMIWRAGLVALLMRHSAVVIVAVVVLVDPGNDASTVGRALIGLVGGWSAYRLLTRSHSPPATAVDYLCTLTVCLAIPALVADPQFHTTNSAPLAIVGTAVISFAVSLPARVSLAMTLGVAACYAFGAAAVIGWPHVVEIFNLYYFAIQWVTSAVIRMLVLRVADAVDAASAQRQAAEVTERVTSAVREYDREQLRLLHDTVASTLLMVAQGTELSAERLAGQARRDLAVLGENPWAPTSAIDLVAALREAAGHARTPVRYRGLESLWLDGKVAAAIAAAAREAITNIDRHAHASAATIDVGIKCVQIHDDGIGFDIADADRGHGISKSIVARMAEIGGTADISSAPQAGTTVELTWPPTQDAPPTAEVSDPDRLIERTRVGYGVALTGYAVANLLVMAPVSFTTTDHKAGQAVLAAVAGLCTLSALPAMLNKRWWPPWPAVGALLITAAAQSALLPADELGTQAQWSQATVGWCLLPLVLGLPLRYAGALICLSWVVVAVITLGRDTAAHLAVNLGLGTASILTVQLFALLFYGLIRGAARDARDQADAKLQAMARERIGAALQAEYRRRFADLAASVRPLLIVLSNAEPLDAVQRRRAGTAHGRLRALFDQSATFDHSLMQELRPLVDSAEDRHVDVSVHTEPDLPEIGHAEVRRLAGALAHALAITGGSARIALTSTGSGLEASIVCNGLCERPTAADFGATGDDDLELTMVDETLWLTVRSRARKGPDEDADTHIETV